MTPKLNKVTWFDWNGCNMPVQDRPIDVCTSLFGQFHKKRLRVLPREWSLVVVAATSSSLIAWKTVVSLHRPEKFLEPIDGQFELQQQQLVESANRVDRSTKNLIAMTHMLIKRIGTRMILEQEQHFLVTALFNCVKRRRQCCDGFFFKLLIEYY